MATPRYNAMDALREQLVDTIALDLLGTSVVPTQNDRIMHNP